MQSELNKLRTTLSKTNRTSTLILNRISTPSTAFQQTQANSENRQTQFPLEPTPSASRIVIEKKSSAPSTAFHQTQANFENQQTQFPLKPTLSASRIEKKFSTSSSSQLKLIKLTDLNESSCDEADEDDEIGTPPASSSTTILSSPTFPKLSPISSLGAKRHINFDAVTPKSKKTCENFPSSAQQNQNKCNCDISEVKKIFNHLIIAFSCFIVDFR